LKLTRLTAVGAVVAAGALALSGCTQPYESEVVEGTEITVAYNDNFFHFNDVSSAGNNTANGNVKYMTDTTFAYYDDTPELVRNTDFGSFEKVSDDPLTVEYTVTSNAVWSDGVPIDESDLLLAWASSSGNVEGGFSTASTAGLELITQVPEVADKKITLVYDQPYVDWELAFDINVSAHGTYALAFPEEYADVQAAWDTYAGSGEQGDWDAYSSAAKTFAEDAKAAVVSAIQDGDTSVLEPLAAAWNEGYGYVTLPESPAAALTSGPYIIDDIVEDEYITIAANPLFTWGPSPKFEKITIRTISDSTAALQALESGELDIWTGQPTADTLEIALGISNASVEQRVQASHEHIDLTVNNGGPFDPATYGGDAAKAELVRQAFLLTIPRQEIVDKIIVPLNPEAEVRQSYLTSPETTKYDDLTTASGVAEKFGVGEPDIEAATALLEQAGVDTPVDVKFWYPEGNVRRGQEFELISQSAALAGFNVIDTSEPDWLFTDPSAVEINPHDAVIFAWSQTSLAIGGDDQIYGSYDAPADKGGNYNGYSNAEVDALLEELAVTTEEADQIAIQGQIEALLVADSYGIPIFQFPGLLVWSDNVTGVKDNPLSPNFFWNFWEWAPVEG
jgi:peptide/nickel transport system substrate-binding protein